VIVFLDADHSDDPREAALLLDRIAEGYDLVVGSRVLGQREPGALLPQARFGNWLAAMLIRLRFERELTFGEIARLLKLDSPQGADRAVRAALARLRKAMTG
jgi:hypothetical protein